MKFYTKWIQQGKVPPGRTPFVPVNAQSNCPDPVELDDGDVKDRFPASAIEIPAESTPGNSIESNPGDEQRSASPITPVSVCVTRADTAILASNYSGRPDQDNAASHPSDQAIYSDVQVLHSDRDDRASHNGVPVIVGGYTDSGINSIEVREKGASPPTDYKVLRGRAKGRTSSTPSTQFAYPCIRRSDTASSRSTSSQDEKSKSGITLGRTEIASKSNSKFDSTAQSVRRPTAIPEGSTSPSSPGCFSPAMLDSSDKVESSATTVFKTPVMTKFDRSNRLVTPKFEPNGRYSRSMTLHKPSVTSSTAMQQVSSVRTPGGKFASGQSQYCNCSTRPFARCVNKTAERQVPLPRSNRTGMCVGGPTGRYGNAARRILHRPWISVNQSASSAPSRAAWIHFGQSTPCLQTATDQSEASNPGYLGYKRRRFGQFVSLGPQRAEDRTATLSSIGLRSNTPVRCQFASCSASLQSNTPVRRQFEGQQSNTPVRCHPVHQQSSTPARRQQSNTPVRCQYGSHPNTPVRQRPSSQNLILTCLLRSLWSNCRVRRQQTRRHKLRRSDLISAMYVAMGIWSLPLIGNTCCRIIRWMWSGLLWYMIPPSTSTYEPNSTNN